jgi:hypothetical protein
MVGILERRENVDAIHASRAEASNLGRIANRIFHNWRNRAMKTRLALFAWALAASLVATRQAAATLVNVAQGKPTTGDVAFGFPTGNGNDGNTATFNHADNTNPPPNNPFWQVDLQGTFDLQSIEIVDRNDSCCTPNRLNGSVISVLDASLDTIFTLPEITTFPDGNTSTVPLVYDNGGAGFPGAAHIRVDGANRYFQFAELRATADVSSGNLANLFGTATQSTTGFSRPAAGAIDGNLVSTSHTATGDVMPWWEVDLGDSFRMETINLATRSDCCTGAGLPERDYNLLVEVLDAADQVVYSHPVINPWDGTGAAATDVGDGTVFPIDFTGEPGGGLIGQKVRVSKQAFGGLDDGVNHSEWLAIGELQVLGSTTPIPEPSTAALALFVSIAVVGFRPRRFKS